MKNNTELNNRICLKKILRFFCNKNVERIIYLIIGAALIWGANELHILAKHRRERIALATVIYVDIRNQLLSSYSYLIYSPYEKSTSENFKQRDFNLNIYEALLSKIVILPQALLAKVVKFYGLLQNSNIAQNLYFDPKYNKEECFMKFYKSLYMSIEPAIEIMDLIQKDYKILSQVEEETLKKFKHLALIRNKMKDKIIVPSKLTTDLNNFYESYYQDSPTAQ